MKNNRVLKSKSSSPVKFVNDGIVHSLLQNEKGGKESKGVVHNDDKTIQTAVWYLRTCIFNDKDDGTKEEPWHSDYLARQASSLFRTLKSADSIKQQLHAMQAFKSTMLNWQQKDGNTADSLIAGVVYRILLEWSLSADTTIPLQRALHSSLEVLNIEANKSNNKQVLESLILEDAAGNSRVSYWRDPLHFLDVAVNTPFLCQNLKGDLFTACLSFIHYHWIKDMLVFQEQDSLLSEESAISTSLLLSKLLKTLLQDHHLSEHQIPVCVDFQRWSFRLMCCPTLPMEGFNTLGIVYARLFLEVPQEQLSKKAIIKVQELQEESNSNKLNARNLMANLSIVQGLSTVLEENTLVEPCGSNGSTSITPLEICWRYSLQTSRMATDPMVRWSALKGLSTLASRWKQCRSQNHSSEMEHTADLMIQETLELVLQEWENPPLRKLGTVIPGIFRTLVEILPAPRRRELCQTVLGQPLNRKGRYLALEILLPYSTTEEGASMIKPDSLLEGVGDRGPNTGPIADLWVKVLEYMWEESNHSIDNWTEKWVPSLSKALTEGEMTRRKQVASFCIVRLLLWSKRTKSMKDYLSDIVEAVYGGISKTAKEHCIGAVSVQCESSRDKSLWAYVEIARLLHKQNVSSQEIRKTVGRCIQTEAFSFMLFHGLPEIRLAAFQALEAVTINLYDESMQEEMKLWKVALPFSIKTTENKEYSCTILNCLVNYIDRLSCWESATGVMKTTTDDEVLPLFSEFVGSFLLGEIVLRQGAYPGTTSDKEEFMVLMLEALLAFLLQNSAYTADKNRQGSVFTRKRKPIEDAANLVILKERLVKKEVFAALISMLHTQWDGTRKIAYRVLSKLAVAAQAQIRSLPESLSNGAALRCLSSRGIYLASSPRQREADTGSRLLAFAYILTNEANEQSKFMSRLVNELERRLGEMREAIGVVSRNVTDEEASLMLEKCKKMPLAHGIIRSLMLIMRYRKMRPTLSRETNEDDAFDRNVFEKIFRALSIAMQISLTVVADVRDGETLDGFDQLRETNETADNQETPATPLNVNTGAIGANGAMSKLTISDESQQQSTLATQRIVVGTWLLIKETCATISALFESEGWVQAREATAIGTLLINTLTSLKHAGAAFAARDSLQDIASVCRHSNDKDMQSVPEALASQLMNEMFSFDKIRDSTLRRSTGYALGCQALMRSDLATKYDNSILCSAIMEKMISFALPPETELRSRLVKIKALTDGQDASSLFFSIDSTHRSFIASAAYEPRCRVHALNVLRMIILDAPLADAVRPYIGDAIVASLLGYDDVTWAVRNSSTMVFSAAMLRVVDADKNGTNTDLTSSLAVTITELYRRYPPLSTFLPALMTSCVHDQNNGINDSQLFPVLLLFSRIQPVAISGGAETVCGYVEVMFEALRNKNHATRAACARAIANLCSDELQGSSSFDWTLLECKRILGAEVPSEIGMNRLEGSLLVIDSLLSSSLPTVNLLCKFGLDVVVQEIVFSSRKAVYPPSCVAIAIKILHKITLKEEQRDNIQQACWKICSLDKIGNVAGGATLQAAAAHFAILSTLKVWNPTSLEELQEDIGFLERVLSSKHRDVRLFSVKAFKKNIYHCVDSTISREETMITAGDLLCAVAAMLARCLSSELDPIGCVLGPHVPTVRRLSRCLLECFDGFCLTKPGDPCFFLRRVFTEEGSLWKLAMSMLDLEPFLFEPSYNSNGETYLAGNTAEMMAIQIAADLKGSSLTDAREERFYKLVTLLNDPKASWRSRYSAAKAIEVSQMLTTSTNGSSLMMTEVLHMLQDEDQDVSDCASRAARQALQHESCPDEVVASNVAPTYMLCKLYPCAYAVEDHANGGRFISSTLNSVLATVSRSCNGLITSLNSLTEELDNTRHAPDFELLNNNLGGRKIFEEEDPCPKKEKLLTFQLAIQALTKLTLAQVAPLDYTEYVSDIRETAECSLNILTGTRGGEDIFHDATRNPSIFPSLHSTLIGLAACIYAGVETNAAHVQKMAAGLLLHKNRHLHPEISMALNCLAGAEKRTPLTMVSLEKCLFLLPGVKLF